MVQTQELNASDDAYADWFGSSVSMSGSTILVGAPNHTVEGHSYAGAAYVFTESDGSWSQTQELNASDGAADGFFGAPVSISGSTIVIGAPGEYDVKSGAAYVFTEIDGTWSQTQELTASDEATSDYFAGSVAISGSTIVAGADEHWVDGHASQGAAYVFTESDGTWSQTQELTASDGSAAAFFGSSIAMSGSNILVGAPGANENEGAVYIFGTAQVPLTVVGIGVGSVARHNPTCQTADPVNCASGDFTESTTDVSVPGRGPELDLTRTYNSLDASTEGMFGYGWSSSYQMSLVENEDDSVTITAGDGSQVTAEPEEDDTYSMPSWSDSTLTVNEDGSWTYDQDQTKIYTFNSDGQLTGISDPNGYSETLLHLGEADDRHRCI